MAHNQDLVFDKIFNNGDFERLQTLADATLRTDDGSIFKVHRMLLTYRNDYFSTLFSTEENEFKIPDINGKLLGIVLIYLYTDNISLTEENVADVLLASNRFKVDDLMSICQEFATRNINIANCLQLFTVAFEIGDSTLINTCYRYLKVHFGEVIKETGNTIGDMKFEALEKILKDGNLNVTSEKVTWWAAVKWVEKRQHERLSFVPNIVEHIFSKELDTDVKIEILTHPLVKDNSHCKDINSKYINKSSEACLEYLKEDMKPVADIRKSRSPLHVNFIVRYRNVDDNSHSVQLYLTYDHQVDMWRHVGDIDFWPDSLIRIRQKIYIFNALQDRRMAFDVLNETFTLVSPMSMPRFHYHVVALENRIYALGGGTEANEATSILESYDPETDAWNLQRPMVPMILSDVVALDGRIFAIGADEMMSEIIFQVYDPTSDSWDRIRAPSVHRHQFASAHFQGHLYTIGGYQAKFGSITQFEAVKIVEAYDPASDTWKYIPSLPFAYMSPKAVVFDQKLIVFDNVYKSMYSGVRHPSVSWNPDNETWKVASPGSWLMDIHLYQVYVVEDRELLKELLSRNRSPKVHWVQSFLKLSSK